MTSATTTLRRNPFVSPYTKRQMDADIARIASEGGTALDVGNTLYEKYGYTLDGYSPSEARTPSVPSGPIGAPDVSMAGTTLPMSFTLGALQGLTFGTGIAGMGSLMGWAEGEGAQAGRDQLRQLYAGLEETSPVSTMAGEVTGLGVLASATGAGPAIAQRMAGAGRLARIGAGTALGAGASAGMAAGETPGGIEPRVQAAIDAAGPGAAIGAVTAISPMVALMTLGAGAGAMTSKESPLVGAAAGAGTALLAVKQGGKAGSAVMGFLDKLRGVAHAEGSAPAKARTYLADLLIKEHGSIENAMAKINVAEAGGQPLAVADLLGPDAPAILTQLEATRSPAVAQLVSQLRGRQDGQQGRIMQQLMRSFRLGSANAHDVADVLTARMDDESAPLFAAAWEDVVPVDDRLRNLLTIPQVREAYNRGVKLEALKVANETGGAAESAIPALPDDLSELTSLPVRALHNIKRGVRDMATEASSSGKSLTRESQRDLFGLASRAREFAAEASPNYKGATTVFRGHAESLNALQRGKGGRPLMETGVIKDVDARPRFITRSPDDVKADLAKLDPADKPLYILGAMQDVDDLLSSQLGRDPKLLSKMGLYGDVTRETRFTKSIRALFDDKYQADELIERLRNEARLVRAPNRTASAAIRQFNELAGQAERDATLASGQIPGALGRVVSTVGSMLKPAKAAGPDPLVGELSDELSNLLLSGVNGYGEARATVNGLLPYVPRPVAPKGYRPLIPLAAGQQVGSTSQRAPQ